MHSLFSAIHTAVARLKAIHPLAPWLVALIALLPLPWLPIFNNYHIYLMNIICVMIILSVGLNIVKGFCGQVTVGHVALYAVGAYTSAVLSLNFGLPFWLALPLAVLATAVMGALVGIPSFRLEGAYLALATLGFAQSVEIYIRVTNYLGAASGMSGIPAPAIGSFKLDTYQSYYYLVMPVMVLAVYVSFAILNSATGRAFMAVREDPLSAAAMGVNVRRYKLYAFVLSAIYAGLAGSMFAHMTPGYIHPNNFTIIEMVILLLMVVLGGIGNIWGGVIGAILVTIIADITRDYYFYQMLLFGAVIVATVLFMPKGIGGIINRYFVSKQFVATRELTAERQRRELGNAQDAET